MDERNPTGTMCRRLHMRVVDPLILIESNPIGVSMKAIITLSMLMFAPLIHAQDPENWAKVLNTHVKETTLSGVRLNAVNYEGIASDASFRAYLKALDKPSLSKLDETEKKALWINAYNVLAIQVVVDHWPVKSIKDAGGLIFGKVWDIKVGRVAGQIRTLTEIEHKILRKMGDPRIHAAIVCASVSCPDLRNEPYTSKNLDRQLDSQMKDFLANDTKGLKLDRNKKRVTLSPIFKWFADDFKATDGTVIDFIIRFAPKDDQSWLEENKSHLTVAYFDYNWNLNRL